MPSGNVFFLVLIWDGQLLVFYTPRAWNDAKFMPYQMKVIKTLRNFTFQAVQTKTGEVERNYKMFANLVLINPGRYIL